MKKLKCPHCGKTEENEDDLTIQHRGCRLKAAFPNTYEKKGRLLVFDLEKIRKKKKI